jgi:hypothetical protein
MTSDFSPEGSPFRPVDETTWALELLKADEQDNLDVIRQVIRPEEETEFTQAQDDFAGLSDDELSVAVADAFEDESTFSDILAGLGYADNVEQQFATIGMLTVRQKAGLLVLLTRIWGEEQQA